jgi:hypothetical protein
LPGKGHITLGQIAQRLNVLVIHCDRCRRREQYALWKLIVKFGTEASIEPLQQEMIAACTNRTDRRSSPGKAALHSARTWRSCSDKKAPHSTGQV